MTAGPSVDGVLVQWGERLFFPRNRIVKANPTPRLDTLMRRKAAVIRKRIQALAVRRAPEVIVKIAGGGRGMRAIAAQFSYITRNGELALEGGCRSHGVARWVAASRICSHRRWACSALLPVLASAAPWASASPRLDTAAPMACAYSPAISSEGPSER